jgi:hypothetical protein
MLSLRGTELLGKAKKLFRSKRRNIYLAGTSFAIMTIGILCLNANAQTNEWAWMSGNKTPEIAVYGTLGTPNVNNLPGNRSAAVNWTDKQGNLWLFGGNGADSTGKVGYLNDLWEYSPTTNQWTWMAGTSTFNGFVGSGVSGTLRTASPGNIPQGRSDAVRWTDVNGNFWLFGGYNYGNANIILTISGSLTPPLTSGRG